MKNENCERDIKLCEALFSEAEQNKEKWHEIVSLVMPEINNKASLKDREDDDDIRRRVCGHAQTDIFKLAAAHGSLITPMGQKWFQFEPWYYDQVDEADWQSEQSWYGKISEICLNELAKSNFYTEKNSVDIDRCLTGSGLLFAEGDATHDLSFTHVPAGTYALAEDSHHNVCTVVRKIKMTPAQIVDSFGIENVSERIRAEYEDVETRYNRANEREIFHLVEKRPEGKYIEASDLVSPDKMKYRSVYIDITEKRYLMEDGYYEFPFMATRFRRYGNSPYGRSPLSGVLDDIKDLIGLNTFNFISAQKKAIPPILISAELDGEVDPRAGGQTIVSAMDAKLGLPREWANTADIRESLEQIAEKKQNIDNATYVNIIQAVTQNDKQMTATEVASIEAEKVMTFSGSFTQYVTDFRPLLNRVFCILARQDKIRIEDAPKSVAKRFLSSDGAVVYERILPPNVAFIGKMAQTLQMVQQNGLNTTLSELVSMYKETQDPEWLLLLKTENIARWKLNAAAVPYRCIKTPEEVQAARAMMQQQQQMAQQAALAEQAAAAQKDFAQARSYE